MVLLSVRQRKVSHRSRLLQNFTISFGGVVLIGLRFPLCTQPERELREHDETLNMLVGRAIREACRKLLLTELQTFVSDAVRIVNYSLLISVSSRPINLLLILPFPFLG